MPFQNFVHALGGAAFAAAIPELADIVVDSVESGASVGFERPFSTFARCYTQLAP